MAYLIVATLEELPPCEEARHLVPDTDRHALNRALAVAEHFADAYPFATVAVQDTATGEVVKRLAPSLR